MQASQIQLPCIRIAAIEYYDNNHVCYEMTVHTPILHLQLGSWLMGKQDPTLNQEHNHIIFFFFFTD